jgi:hypothetical protein
VSPGFFCVANILLRKLDAPVRSVTLKKTPDKPGSARVGETSLPGAE